MRAFVFSLFVGIVALVATNGRLGATRRPAGSIRGGSCGEQSIRWNLEIGRPGNPQCERPDRSVSAK